MKFYACLFTFLNIPVLIWSQPHEELLKFSSRIIGGNEVAPHSLPYQALVYIPLSGQNFQLCGGSLISQTTVLTAAHCTSVISNTSTHSSSNVFVTLGAHDLDQFENDTRVTIENSEIIVHPNYNNKTLRNDIAILRFPNAVDLNDNIKLIPLPSRNDESNDFFDDIATASGWGRFSTASNATSLVLRSVDVPVIINTECKHYFPGYISDGQICTSGAGGKGACNADSGGPLRSSNGLLIGIASFVKGNCQKDWPSVFTRVTSYLDWIAENSDVIIN